MKLKLIQILILMSATLKVIIKNKVTIPIDVNLNKDTVNDLINKVRSKVTGFDFDSITMSGITIHSNEFSKKLSDYFLEDGDHVCFFDNYE
jgi:hypothetical protein